MQHITAHNARVILHAQMDWSLGLSLGITDNCSQDSTVFHKVEAGQHMYEWSNEEDGVPIFAVSGFKRDSQLVCSVWLVPNETAIGRLLCYKGTTNISHLHFVYPTQMPVDCFRVKPRRNSVAFTSTKKDAKTPVIALNSSAPALVSIEMSYTCRYSYKSPGSAELHAQLKIVSIRVNMKDWGILLEYLRHDAGHRVVLVCNDTYLGTAQEIRERNEATHRTYQWLSIVGGASLEGLPLRDEEYDKAIINGFNDVVKSPRGVAVGSLLSPRVTPRNIKTPRPISHLPKMDIIQPPFIPDTVGKRNDVRRLQSTFTQNDASLTFKVFNFRFTPPRYVSHKIQWNDFDAAYQRTVAQSKITSTTAVPLPTPAKQKTFKSRKREKRTDQRQQLEVYAQLVCRLERSIAHNIELVVLFKMNVEEKRVYLGEVLLEVNNFDTALLLE